MVVSISSRLGVTLWSDEADPYTRTQAQGSAQALDSLAAIDVGGLESARGAPATRGRYYHSTDTGVLWRDTGTAWFQVSPTFAGPGASAPGLPALDGVAGTAARSDHQHSRESYAAASAGLIIGGGGAGIATTISRGDHTHTLSAGGPGVSQPGDLAAAGSSVLMARADHQHAREAFGVTGAGSVLGLLAGGASNAGSSGTVADAAHQHALPSSTPGSTVQAGGGAAVGTSTQVARADHVHTLGAATAPSASTPGNPSSMGTATDVARGDHQHGREGFGVLASISGVTGGAAALAGASGLVADAGHVHAVGSGAPSASLRGTVGTIGTSGALARADHAHAREAAPVMFTVARAVDNSGTGFDSYPGGVFSSLLYGSFPSQLAGAWLLLVTLKLALPSGSCVGNLRVTVNGTVLSGDERVDVFSTVTNQTFFYVTNLAAGTVTVDVSHQPALGATVINNGTKFVLMQRS